MSNPLVISEDFLDLQAQESRFVSPQQVTVDLGDKTFKLNDLCGGIAYSADYVGAAVQENISILDPYDNDLYMGLRGQSTLYVTAKIFDSVLSRINDGIYACGSVLEDLRVLVTGPALVILSENEFNVITAGRPSWAGVCVVQGYVVYNGAYIDSVLAGDGDYRGHHFTAQDFAKEMAHELNHWSFNMAVFEGDTEMTDHFCNNSQDVLEGMATSTADQVQRQWQFKMALSDILREHPNFSRASLASEESFARISRDPVMQDFAYQYCSRWLKSLAITLRWRIVSKSILAGETVKTDKPFYDGIMYVWQVAKKRYRAGVRESFYDVVASEFGITSEDLIKSEKVWQNNLLYGYREPL